MGLAKDIFQAKIEIGAQIKDPEQEKLVLDRAVDMATEHGLDAGDVKEIFKILIRMSRQKQQGLEGDEAPS